MGYGGYGVFSDRYGEEMRENEPMKTCSRYGEARCEHRDCAFEIEITRELDRKNKYERFDRDSQFLFTKLAKLALHGYITWLESEILQ